MNDNLAQLLGFALNVLAVGVTIVIIMFFDMEPPELILYAAVSLVGGLVPGTILITLGKIQAILEKAHGK